MILFGWFQRFTVLGVKLDECATCGQVGRHQVGRKTLWVHVFWIPVLFLRFTHGMACERCGAWTGIPWRTVRAAMRTGTLLLDRPRPNAPAALAAAGAEDGAPPLSPDVLDRFVVNPKRGFWDGYLKAWPVIIVLLIVVAAVNPFPRSTPSTTATTTPHDCWEASDGSINGCRLADGTVQGDATGSPVTCFFTEPLPSAATTLRCAPR